MSHPVKGIDHVFLLVKDLDASAETYRRLGFTISPRGTHSPEMGSANYTFVFEDDYAELLGVIADTPQSRQKTEMIERDGEGLRAIACRIDDAREAKAALGDLGIATGEVRDFSRPLPLPDGSTGTAAFAVCQFAPEEIPLGVVFMCQHKTPDMVWRPELKSHANSAVGIATVTLVTEAPEAKAEACARLYAAGAITTDPEGNLRVTTGERSGDILILTPQAAAARWSAEAVTATPATGFAALSLWVSDLARTRSALEASAVPFHAEAGRIWVEPAHGSGAIIEFLPR